MPADDKLPEGWPEHEGYFAEPTTDEYVCDEGALVDEDAELLDDDQLGTVLVAYVPVDAGRPVTAPA